MAPRHRSFLPGLLGLGLITFPFLWLGLRYDFATGDLATVWNGANGVKFFTNLLLAFAVAGVLWALVASNRRWDWWRPVDRTLGLIAPVFEQVWVKPLVALLVAGAVFFLDNKSLDTGVQLGLYMLLALGLNITVGFTGLLVLGYAAFFAFGAYLFAIGQHFIPGLQWWVAFPIIFVLGGLLGWALGLPCLRLRGDYLAIVTLGFAESFKELLSNLEIAGGDKGLLLTDASALRPLPGLSTLQTTYLLVCVVLFVSLFWVRRLYNSPIGRAWVAIREDETAANAMGIDVVSMKLLAFALSAALGSIAGLLYILHASFINPSAAAFHQSVMILAMVVLGGIGSIYGVLLGAALLHLIPQFLRDSETIQQYCPNFADYRLLLFGVIMVAIMLLRPQGLLGSAQQKEEITHEP